MLRLLIKCWSSRLVCLLDLRFEQLFFFLVRYPNEFKIEFYRKVQEDCCNIHQWWFVLLNGKYKTSHDVPMSSLIHENDSAINLLQNKVSWLSSIQIQTVKLREKLAHIDADLHQSVVTFEIDAEKQKNKKLNFTETNSTNEDTHFLYLDLTHHLWRKKRSAMISFVNLITLQILALVVQRFS